MARLVHIDKTSANPSHTCTYHIQQHGFTATQEAREQARRDAASFSSEWANGGYVNGAGDYGITTCLTVITDVGKRALRARLMLSYSYDDRSSSAGAAFDTDDGGNNVFVLWWVLVQGWAEPHTHTHTLVQIHNTNVYTVLQFNPHGGFRGSLLIY